MPDLTQRFPARENLKPVAMINRELRVETLACPGDIRPLPDPANTALAPYLCGAFVFEKQISR